MEYSISPTVGNNKEEKHRYFNRIEKTCAAKEACEQIPVPYSICYFIMVGCLREDIFSYHMGFNLINLFQMIISDEPNG